MLYLLFSTFGFLVLAVPVPDHCLLLTFCQEFKLSRTIVEFQLKLGANNSRSLVKTNSHEQRIKELYYYIYSTFSHII